MNKQYRCCVSNQIISEERVQALKQLGTPEHLWACVEYADFITKKKQGLYDFETGVLSVAYDVKDEPVVFEELELDPTVLNESYE